MLLLRDNSKYGLLVTSKLQSRLQFWVAEAIINYLLATYRYIRKLSESIFASPAKKVLKHFLLMSYLGIHHS